MLYGSLNKVQSLLRSEEPSSEDEWPGDEEDEEEEEDDEEDVVRYAGVLSHRLSNPILDRSRSVKEISLNPLDGLSRNLSA